MKRLLLLAALLYSASLLSPAQVRAEEVPIDQDPMFAEMLGETPARAPKSVEADASSDEPSFAVEEERASPVTMFEGSLEDTAAHFEQVCYANLGPASACFEDYDTLSCQEQRDSCRRAGEYSR